MYNSRVLGQVTPDELDEIIHGLKNSAVGHDDVDAGHLKAAYQFVKTPYFTSVINPFFRVYFQVIWK